MAFGSGVLISAVAFDLMEEAADTGGLPATALGFLGGAVVYLAANLVLARRGARHRKRSGDAAAVGAGAVRQRRRHRDRGAARRHPRVGRPRAGPARRAASVSLSVLAAVFISNVPEGLSSAAGMKRNGRSARYVFGVWVGIAVASGLAALLGYVAARRRAARGRARSSPRSPRARSSP